VESDSDAVGLALEVDIVTTRGHFAGTDAGGLMTVAMVAAMEESVTPRIVPVANGNGVGMTGFIVIVGTLCGPTFDHFGHCDGFFHGWILLLLLEEPRPTPLLNPRSVSGFCQLFFPSWRQTFKERCH
jgi:membrane associated rhomboid family serine protease